jgi:hypothetical protein
MPMARLYSYKDKVIIPTVAQAQEGFYFDEEPVTVCDITDMERLRQLLAEALSSDNQVVPTPQRSQEHDPGSPILEKLNLKKWLKFEAEAAMYSVHTNSQWRDYYTSGNAVDGCWRPNQTRQMKFAFDKGIEPVISQIINDIESDVRARKGSSGGLMLLLPPPKS